MNKKNLFNIIGRPSGFTLVELIITITILVILGSIALISIGDYIIQSRDSQRTANISTLSKGLEVFFVKSSIYPLPDNYIQISNSGTVFLNQGVAGSTVSSIVKASPPSFIDPVTKLPFSYSVSNNQKRYELLAILEKPLSSADAFSTIIPESYADSSVNNSLITGSEIGILVDPTSGIPADRDHRNIDISTATGAYRVLINNTDKIEGTGSKLIGLVYLQDTGRYDNSLAGYWDMESVIAGNLADMSGNGNNGLPLGGIIVGGVDGKFGKATYSATNSGSPQFVRITQGNDGNLLIPDNITVNFWFKYEGGDCNYCSFLNNNNNLTTGYMIQRHGTGTQIYMRIDTETSGSGYNQTAGYLQAMDGKWHNIAYAINTGKRKAYLDGKLYYTDNYNHLGGFSSRGNMILFTGYNSNFQLSLDEVRIYNKILTDTDIKNLYLKNSTQ